ncbi:MAG: DUF3302 domain-containing protein [Planctomycetota bacterium]|jgi:membrane protein implicated in regulation of membrane protease activity
MMVFAFLVLVALICLGVYVFVLLAAWPGKIAAERDHAQAEAVRWCGWLGLLLTAGIVWIFAMVWARMRPTTGDGDRHQELLNRIGGLEKEIRRLEAAS